MFPMTKISNKAGLDAWNSEYAREEYFKRPQASPIVILEVRIQTISNKQSEVMLNNRRNLRVSI